MQWLPTFDMRRVRDQKRTYLKLSDEIGAKIGKYSCENGDSVAARHFMRVLGKPINCSTACGLKKTYLQELSCRRRAEEDLLITGLPSKKQGCPLLFGEELAQKVQQYLSMNQAGL